MFDCLKSSISSSPSGGTTNSKSSPDSLHKVSTAATTTASTASSNGRMILPKTITGTQSSAEKKMPPTNATYSSQIKCQNDAKQHSSYSSVFHSKPITNSKPTSINSTTTTTTTTMLHHQPPSRQINGSYTRLTNKLNCCKSCVRDTDDALLKKCTNEVSIPKLKNDIKYPSQFIDSNANCCYESEQQSKYKLTNEARRSTIPGALRRHSNDTNSMLRKSNFKHSFDENLIHGGGGGGGGGGDFRQHSFDDGKTTMTNVRLLKKLTPSPTRIEQKHQSDFHRNGNGNYLSQSINKHLATSNDNRRLIKQKSLDDYTDATARLRKLEMKMRKHKIDVLKYANNQDQTTVYADPKKLLAYPPPNHFRSKLEPFARTKADCVYPKIAYDSVLQSKPTTVYRTKNGTNGGSYGIITSSELYKLRGTPERVT